MEPRGKIGGGRVSEPVLRDILYQGEGGISPLQLYLDANDPAELAAAD